MYDAWSVFRKAALSPRLIATHLSNIQHPEPIRAVVEARRNQRAWVNLKPPITQSSFQLSEKGQDTSGGLQSPDPSGGSSSIRKRRSPRTCTPWRVRPGRAHPNRSVNANAAPSRTHDEAQALRRVRTGSLFCPEDLDPKLGAEVSDGPHAGRGRGLPSPHTPTVLTLTSQRQGRAQASRFGT
ncbi:hypothetical protein GSI_10655 [Ganoderma sinense ZZ0214-1]|uniref:Uncharacterized protein n=1 Tax=Ganoderma sinense ZZ0214-1 TaxID=1077348 RepID=A0A2G8S187_9APHY|nr:hypothetical protein GSI_10655 [Ganoderma sinense ZZ0214-1]